MDNLYNFSYIELVEKIQYAGFSQYHADQIWKGLYIDLIRSFDEIKNLRPDLRRWLNKHATLYHPDIRLSIESRDQLTHKFLLGLEDNESIETVIMRFEGRRDRPDETERYTACISTQVGCAMGCVFCATGQMGFNRHLSVAEIVGQIIFVEQTLRMQNGKLRNIVLMGMGEPLHNYDNSLKAIRVLTAHKGMSLAPSRITLSTVGIPSAIRRLADEQLPINLAVSLHGSTDEERRQLVPPARRWPLDTLMDACRYYTKTRKRRVFFEWTLIHEKNDTPEQAIRLGQLLEGIDSHVNVIPLNPTDGYAGVPSDMARVKRFQEGLAEYGVPSTVRQRRGIDIAAGCGQLRQRADADK